MKRPAGPLRRSQRLSRRRLKEPGDDTGENVGGNFERLSRDLLLGVLEYCSTADLDRFACASAKCRSVTDHPVLKRERWGTLIIRPGTTVRKVLQTLSEANDRGIFHRIHCLTIRYKERQDMATATQAEVKDLLRSTKLSTITKLEMAAPRHVNLESRWTHVPPCIPCFFSKIMPNLEEARLEISSNRFAANNFAKNCRLLTTFSFTQSCDISLKLDGREFKSASHLTYLNLDGTRFCARVEEHETPESIEFLLHIRSTIERVSVKNVCAWFYDPITDDSGFYEPSDAIMVDFVRNAPRLKWFRSDICENCKNMLQEERPDVFFTT